MAPNLHFPSLFCKTYNYSGNFINKYLQKATDFEAECPTEIKEKKEYADSKLYSINH